MELRASHRHLCLCLGDTELRSETHTHTLDFSISGSSSSAAQIVAGVESVEKSQPNDSEALVPFGVIEYKHNCDHQSKAVVIIVIVMLGLRRWCYGA